MSTHVLKVESLYDRKRLDAFLAENLLEVPSRVFVKKLLDADHVRVNQAKVKACHKVRAGDEVCVEIPDQFLPQDHIEPEDIPLDIFYEDDFLLVVHKPAGMVVHPGSGVRSGTLVNALMFHCDRLSDANEASRPGIVHRLDKETSGLMVVAKDNKTHVQLARQFQKRTVHKKYIALVEGEVEFDEGMVDAPLGRHTYHPEKIGVQYTSEAREAVTRYRVIRRCKGVTLIDLFPQTGRTHQLRVHMSHLRHPILGDAKYGRKESFPRLALHAHTLGFIHPHYKTFLEFSCKPPREFLDRVGVKGMLK